MREAARRLFGLSLTASAALTYYIKSRPLPVEDLDVAEGLEASLWSCVTADGLTLRGKRYATPGGQPIILAHCFAGNGLEFDIPKKGFNLAVYLARRGYDVYMYNVRGCGREPYFSDPGDWMFTLDHFAAFDAPAVIDKISREAGKKPVWLGHSMGGAILYMYLQGASLADDGRTFEADAAVAEQRNASIAAGVTLASPISFTWPKGAPFGRIMRSGAASRALDKMAKLLRSLPPERQKFPFIRYTAIMADMLPRLTSVIFKSPFMSFVHNPRNVDGAVMTLMARTMLDNLSVRMAVQFLEDMRDGDSMDFSRTFDYTSHMDRITAPMLFLCGSRDFLSADEIERCAYSRVSSAVKGFFCFDGYGHLDLAIGCDVENTVYPCVADWLAQVTGAAH